MYKLHYAFREVHENIVKALVSKVYIRSAKLWDPLGEDYIDCEVLWDTGSTNSIINMDYINNLNLKPFLLTALHTLDDVKPEVANVYIIDMILPNNVSIENFRVIGKKLIRYDMILGMDIIQTGDFCISNSNGRTMFSFCLPSLKDRIDLTYISGRINKSILAKIPILRVLRKFKKLIIR